jgi:hypothetical protein
MTRRSLVAEHLLQRADALPLELAPPGKVSRDGVVWWSVDHAAYAGTWHSHRAGNCRGCAGPIRAAPWHRPHVEIKTLAGELSDPQQSVMAAVLAGGRRGARC